MDGPSETETRGPGQVALSQRNLSLSEDDSLLDSTMDIGDEDLLFTDLQDDDDDDLGSSSELSVSPFEQADYVIASGGSKQSSDSSKDTLPSEATAKADLTGKPESSLLQSTRSSGRLRKEKVPNQRKNLFPGRPRVTNRGRKFNMNLSEPLVSFKSPSSAAIADSLELDNSKLSLDLLSNTDDGNSSEVNSALTTPDTSLDAISHPFTQDDTASAIVAAAAPIHASTEQQQKFTSAKKKAVNYPGKIKGKLNNRKKAKLVEYRRKRGSKTRFKPFNSPAVTITSFPSTAGTIASQEADSKQDDSNENKIILCNSKDYFVMSQDLCLMCGSLGKDDEGRLLSCSQCGQCYHPFCAGVTRITKIMLKKGWRCLECTVCEGCGKPTDESRLLLCDDCDISYHTYCLDPPLENVPQGTWKCQWCVICIKCNTTTPGVGSQWQANYTLCGPCASQENCSLCKEKYTENDLIIQCNQCSRWLHSKCDSMLDEDECEIAACIGFTCLRCRPSDQLPPHIQARRTGTLRSLLNKKRSEEKVDPAATSNKKPEVATTNDVPEVPALAGVSTAAEPLSASTAAVMVPVSEPASLINNPNKLSKYHLMNGVYLSEHGFSVIKSLTMEQPKKTRVKRKPNAGNDEQVTDSHLDENAEEKVVNDLESLAKQNDEERKARQRRLKLEKLGIGGFSIKQRGRLSCNKEDEDLILNLNQDSLERSGTPEGDKPKRRRRINRKQKSQLQESFPSYMQEAFFGKSLLDTIQTNCPHHPVETPASDAESADDELDPMNSLCKDNIIELSSSELSHTKSKEDDLNIFDDNFQGSLDDDLPAGEAFEDLQLSPDDMIMDMLINENLERNDEVLDELTNGSKIDADGKDDMDILDGNFNFNDIVDESGLPQMDCKDVEDLFNEVMSDSSIQQQPQQKDFPMPSASNNNQVPMLTPKPTVEPIQLPNLMHPKMEMLPSNHPALSNVSTPVTPLSADPLASITPKPFEANVQTPIVGAMNQFGQPISNQSQETSIQQQWQNNNEVDNEASTQGQKNFLKWEAEEALGTMSTISPVLYANLNFPNLKNEYPVWGDRLKQISKLWRQLSSDQRQPFLQKARENRAANRIQKSQSDSVSKMNISMGKDIKNEVTDQQKQWKELQSPHSNPASVMMGESSSTPTQCQQMSSPANEIPFSQIPDYNHQPPNQIYSPSQMVHSQVKMQPSSPMLLNRPPPTSGSAAAVAPPPPPLQSPMSPMMHSPRLRPTMQSGPFAAENYGQQVVQPHQMNPMVRSSAMVSQGSFSPASPNINQVHSIPSTECYHSSNPSTPQRPQSTDPQHSFGQATSPYGVPPRTPSNMMNPFSPSHHSQMQMHGSTMSNDSNFGMSSHPAVSQASMENSPNVDMYKVNVMTPQHQISKPHTPDSFGPSLPSSLPSTPQPPSSPQVPAQSPLSDIYARSPATPRSAPVNSQVRPPFEDSYNQRQMQPDLYSPTSGPSGNFQQPYMQTNTYNIGDGFANTPAAAAKVQMRPNMNPSIRPNVPLRRTVSSDPYARQPMTPMPTPTPDPHNPYGKPDDTGNDPVSKQQLRNLLQVHQMRRQETTTSQPRPPNWTDNGFRQPLSPAMARNRMPIPSPNQYSMEQAFRYPPDQQRMMLQRGPDMRFRHMVPPANQQFSVPRYSQQMPPQAMHSPGQQSQISQPQIQQPQSSQIRPQQPQQQSHQQWTRMPMHSSSPSSVTDMNPMMNQPVTSNQVPQSQANVVSYSQHNQNFQQTRTDMNAHMQVKPETKNSEVNEHNKALTSGDIGQLADDENLPVELGENDDLLELGDDFNILEYGDDEFADKALSGQSGKSNIFDVLDEKDMLNEKEKVADLSKAEEKTKCGKVDNMARAATFNQGGFNAMNTSGNMDATSSGQGFGGNKPNANQGVQSIARQEQGFFPSNDVLLSDDEFERLKMDFLNDPPESSGNPIVSSVQPQVANSLPAQQQQHQPPALTMQQQVQHQHQHQQPNLSQQQQIQQPGLSQPQQVQPVQFHQHQQQHGPQFASGQANPGQPMWQDQQTSIRQANFPNRMHLRMPMNQPSPIPRHLQPPPQQALYGPTPNRMMLHHTQQTGHMPISPVAMSGIRHPVGPNIPPPPQPPPEVMNEQDRQQQVQYEQWLIQQNNFIATNIKHLETEMGKLRKMKKSLNAKQRQCRKNQNELTEHDSNELARVTQEIHGMQKTLDQARKSMRHHNLLIQEYRQKHGSTFNLPHSPGAPTVQTSPRSVNSPLAAMNTSGPGTPLGIGPSTPQSPSITSPSPSSLMQNSPLSTLHSPASMMPPSPIHHSPMPPNVGQDIGATMRPQIVQEDNNPFSDVYLQKEKKQHMQQSPVYSHQMGGSEMAESRQQMYASANYGEDGSVQQYYHSQSQMSYQMNSIRPQSHAHYPAMSETATFQARFGTAHNQPMNQQYTNQQHNYQQIRRPPPPPYPGKPQHFNTRPYQGGSQIRPQQMRSSQDCMPMRMQHPMYGETVGGGGGMMVPEQYGMNQQAEQGISGNMQHKPMGQMVGEAMTSMEFNISELGPGHDNQSDPSSLVQESDEQKPQTSSSDNASHLANRSESSFANSTASTNQEDVPLPSFNIKREILDDTSSNSNANEEFEAAQLGQYLSNEDNHQYQDSFQSSAASNSANDNSTDESAASKQEATRQNALLKQLLQNCPSADVNKGKKEPQASNVVISTEKEIKFESSEKSSCQHAQQHPPQEANILTVANVHSDRMALESSVELDVAIGESMNIQNLPCIHPESSNSPSSSTPNTEKKLTYLDIRRAQLERDPTPPPEEKPKRKRTVKRKESKSIDDSLESTSNQSGGPPTTPKSTKKRVRKGSQNRAEEPNNSNEHHEHMLKSLIAHLRSLPAIPIVEPSIEPNLNLCIPADAPDFNSREAKLRGSFGNAFLSSTIDYYSTYPFGPNKASSIVPTIPPAVANNNTNNGNSNSHSNNNRAYYYEEFAYMKNIAEFEDHFQEQSSKNSLYSLYSRDTDSPETVVSSSSPECVLYDMPPDEYNKMKYINDDCDQLDLDRDCESPVLFMPLPIRPTPLYGDLNEHDIDKENQHDDQKLRPIRLNGIPLKETGNVNITLMLPNELDIRNVIISLAKLLRVTQSITYNVEKSPTSKKTDVVKIEDEDGEIITSRCKFCEETFLKKSTTDSSNEKEDYEREGFCSAECLDNHILVGRISGADKSGDSIGKENDESNECRESHFLGAELQNETEESEIMSIFGSDSSEFAKASLDLEGINIDEKRWKNTRYLYWNGASFKMEPKERLEEAEDEESIERALDKLAICLKANQNAVEKRVCIFCHKLGDGQINGTSRLLNLDVDKWVHLNCALWSNEVYEMLNGALMNVDQAYLRAINLNCSSCERVGASLKCFKIRCNNSYHFPCAVKEKCMFFKDKTIFCPQHAPKGSQPEELTSFAVNRRVFINRDDQKQIAAMIHHGDHNLMRIGSLIFLNIGQLLPHQLQSFHTNSYIYPIGYKISRFYWSSRRLGKRCQYICSIGEHEGKPEFSIEIREEGYENVIYQDSSPKLVWQKVLEPIIKMREESQTIKVFSDFISGEDLFGLTEPAIIRILESLPGVDTLYDYNFKYGRSPWYELPLAINPTGCARTEPKMRTHFKRPHTLHVSSNTSTRSSLQSSLSTSESTSPYVKQFVHSKISQYRKMKLEWRNNVYLARSRIQGLGLYAVRDIEKHTMIIEYIGLLIRNEIAERNERVHELHNRGIYMFRLDDNRVIDATLSGGLARYVNHSCDPNCVAECVQIGNENKILIIANRRIQRGEEFTYDYKFEVEDDQHKIPCNCGAANCRKWMN